MQRRLVVRFYQTKIVIKLCQILYLYLNENLANVADFQESKNNSYTYSRWQQTTSLSTNNKGLNPRFAEVSTSRNDDLSDSVAFSGSTNASYTYPTWQQTTSSSTTEQYFDPSIAEVFTSQSDDISDIVAFSETTNNDLGLSEIPGMS